MPEPSDPKIFWFNSERDDIVQEIVRRIMERYQTDEDVELILNDAAYNEVRRHEARTDEGTAAAVVFASTAGVPRRF